MLEYGIISARKIRATVKTDRGHVKLGDYTEKEKTMKECCRKYLNEQFGDDAEVVDAIYAEYVSSVGAKTAEADAALAASEWDTLDKVAHTVKGNSLAAGDQQMADAAIALRGAAKSQDRGQAAQLIADMKALAEQL